VVIKLYGDFAIALASFVDAIAEAARTSIVAIGKAVKELNAALIPPADDQAQRRSLDDNSIRSRLRAAVMRRRARG